MQGRANTLVIGCVCLGMLRGRRRRRKKKKKRKK
jgi:hypothetical protein